MGYRVVQPTPLRAIAFSATVLGITMVESSGVRGRAAVVGAVLLCFGIAGLDALALGRVSLRQAAMFFATLGAGLGIWAGTVILVVRIIDLGTDAVAQNLFLAAVALLGASLVCLLMAERARSRPSVRATPRRAAAEVVRRAA